MALCQEPRTLCQEPRQLFSSVLISYVGPVRYYWPHTSHVALKVSDLNN